MELKYFLFFSLDRQQVLLCAVHVRQRSSDLRADGPDRLQAEDVSLSLPVQLLSPSLSASYSSLLVLKPVATHT